MAEVHAEGIKPANMALRMQNDARTGKIFRPPGATSSAEGEGNRLGLAKCHRKE